MVGSRSRDHGAHLWLARIRELQQQLERLSQDRETEEEEETGPRTSTARRPSRSEYLQLRRRILF